MAEPRRLGKRGAYRFGTQRISDPRSGRTARGPQGPHSAGRPPRGPHSAGRPPRGPHSAGRPPRGPAFGSRRSRGPLLWWLAACAATAVVLGFGAALGLWWLPFAAGLAAAAAPWRVRSALALVVLAVAVGWGAALCWPAWSGAPAGATARVIAALAGLPPHAAVGVAATAGVGILQALTAVWLARAAYRLAAR